MIIVEKNVKEIYKIIEAKAKFQKVMLLFDDNVSNFEVAEIYNAIKEICIYNQCDVNELDLKELNNGYRAIIYLCSTNSFLKLKFDRTEFVNLYLNISFLPCCVNVDNTLLEKDNYIFLSNENVDLNLQSSIYFNKFYNYFNNILTFKDNNIEISFENSYINIASSLDKIYKEGKYLEFVDFDVLRETGIEYKYFSLVHLILIDAFFLMINNVKNHTLMLVDVYKSCRENYEMIDKFYAMTYNESFKTIINLNYNYLVNFCLKTKEKILESVMLSDIDEETMTDILLKLKLYTKNCNGILSYLYLFDFFKV